MGLAWNPDQREIYNLLVEGKTNKEIMALGFDKSLFSKVKIATDRGETPPERKPPQAPQKPKLSCGEGEHIITRFKSYEGEEEAIVFIMDPATSNIIDIRHKHPLIFPMFQMSQKEFGYQGSFDEFLVDGVESFFAAQGMELSLAPKSQTKVYNAVLRLVEEKLINITYDEKGNLTLEVPNGDKGKRAKARAGTTANNDKSSPKDKGRKKQPAKPD